MQSIQAPQAGGCIMLLWRHQIMETVLESRLLTSGVPPTFGSKTVASCHPASAQDGRTQPKHD